MLMTSEPLAPQLSGRGQVHGEVQTVLLHKADSLQDFGHVLSLLGVSFLQWSLDGLAKRNSPGVGHNDGPSLVPAFSGVEKEIDV